MRVARRIEIEGIGEEISPRQSATIDALHLAKNGKGARITIKPVAGGEVTAAGLAAKIVARWPDATVKVLEP